MSSLKVKVSFLLGMCVPLSAFAESAAEEIARMNESIAVLSAQKVELELKSQIAAKQLELDKIKNNGAVVPANREPEVLPIIKGIEGMDGKLSAGLLFSNGAQKIVKTGEKIPGGWKVAKITVNSVSLVRKKETVQLGFGHSSTAVPPLPGGSAGGSTSLSPGSQTAPAPLGGSGFPPFAVGR